MSKSLPEYCLLLFCMIMCLFSGSSSAQVFEDINLIDSPTAGMIPHGAYMFEGSIGPRSGLLFGVQVGFHDRLMVGASFGIQEFIGRGDIKINDRPGFQARLRILNESVAGPALALGIDTQGEEFYNEADERYERKSKGFYVVLSKNYYLYKNISFHGGINYSLEDEHEEGMDFFAGVSLEVLSGMSLLFEYSPAMNDDDAQLPSCRTRGKGYMDMGIRFDYKDNLRIRVLFRDLLDNYNRESGVARTIEILFINYF